MSDRELRTYTNPDCVAFVEWAEENGHEPYHYRGRYYWEGPAVNLDSAGEAVGVPVPFQLDGMGLGVVVYPQASDKGVSTRGAGRELAHPVPEGDGLSAAQPASREKVYRDDYNPSGVVRQ